MNDPRLDRVPRFDDRSRHFDIRALVAERKPRSYTWRCERVLNQGEQGACVGFSIAHELIARPKVNLVGIEAAQQIYERGRELDDWPGEDYDGTSVLGGMQAATEMGYYGVYRWAFSVSDLMLAVGYRGPAVLGINWHEGMLETDGDGYVHATGDVVGGHAILCHGVSPAGGYFALHNSWGRDWGVNGTCRISIDDLTRLLRADGEACIPETRKLVAVGTGGS